MMRFLIPLLILVCLLTMCTAAFAGGTPMTDAGSKQMVFRFSGLSNLGLAPYRTDTHGAGLGFRYFFNDGLALRKGIYLGWEKDKTEAPSDSYEDAEDTDLTVSVSAMVEKYMASIHSVAPYIGLGVGYTYDKSESQPIRPTGDLRKDTMTNNYIDFMGAAGFQWYFTDAMSLGGEYVGAFSYSSREDKETDPDGDTMTTKGTSTEFYWYAGSVYLSVHF
jgi:outer membrane protein W